MLASFIGNIFFFFKIGFNPSSNLFWKHLDVSRRNKNQCVTDLIMRTVNNSGPRIAPWCIPLITHAELIAMHYFSANHQNIYPPFPSNLIISGQLEITGLQLVIFSLMG